MAEINLNEMPNNCSSCSKKQKDIEDFESCQDLEKLKRKASIAQQMLNDIMMQLSKHFSFRKSSRRRQKLTYRRTHHKSSSSDTSDNDCQLVELQRCGKDLEARLQNGNTIYRKTRHGHKDRRRDRSRSRGQSRGRSRGHSRGRSHDH